MCVEALENSGALDLRVSQLEDDEDDLEEMMQEAMHICTGGIPCTLQQHDTRCWYTAVGRGWPCRECVYMSECIRT